MRNVSPKTQAELAAGLQNNPGCRVVCDIDPPFVGIDTLLAGARYPQLIEADGNVYLSAIVGDNIKIYSVNLDTKALTPVHTVAAVGAETARAIKNGSTWHTAWGESGSVKYNNGSTTVTLATGSNPDLLIYNETVFCYWVQPDGIYGKSESVATFCDVEAEDGEIFKALRLITTPDGKYQAYYVVETASQDEIRMQVLSIQVVITYLAGISALSLFPETLEEPGLVHSVQTITWTAV